MNSTAFITGATSGFGMATARKLADEGWNLVITGRRQDKLELLCAELSGKVSVLPLCFDVRDQLAVQEAVESLTGVFANVSVLVNNAGLALSSSAAQLCSIDDWKTMVDTNINGMLYATHSLLPQLLKSSTPASIINLGSVAGNWPYPGSHVYGASKAFVKQFTLNLRCDLVGTGVRVTTVEPGLAKTEFSLVRFAGDERKADSVYEGTEPLLAEDIANTISWVISQPKHVNINNIEIMASCQAWNGFNIVRK